MPTFLLLFGGFVLAQADKQVLSLVAQPIKMELALSDTQLGLLQGIAFSFFYALAGVPIAHLIDRGNRIRIAAICVITWSAATAACGGGVSFVTLFALRAGTAVAEAGLPPAAFSIFSEFPSSKRIARATALFMTAPFLGAALALLGGGALLRWMQNAPTQYAGSGWRLVLVSLGGLGAVLGIALLLFAREPARHQVGVAATPPPLLEVLRFMFPRSGFFRSYFAALTVFTAYLYANIAWYPTLLIREFQISTSSAGSFVGAIYLCAGLAGTFVSALLVARGPSFSVRSTVRRFFFSCVVMLLVAVAMPLAPSLAVSLALYAGYAFLSGIIASLMIVPMQILLPSRMQGRAVALYSLATSAVGGSCGPLLVGVLADRLGLTAAMEIVSSVSLILATLLFWSSWRRARTLGA